MENMRVSDILQATGGKLLCGKEDTKVLGVALDSNQVKEGDLFVPLIGERTDAHRYISSAISKGAAAVFTSEHDTMDSNISFIRVEDTKKALQDLGTFYKRRLKLTMIGVTGSVGKTTTREMISAALAAGKKVFRTEGNQNSQVGVPLTLTKIKRDDEIAVIEMGMSETGELKVLAKMVELDMAVVTCIGVAHINQLKTRENICQEKLSIRTGLKERGILILNGDDEYLCRYRGKEKELGCRTLFYGTADWCDYQAKEIREEKGRVSFLCRTPGAEYEIRLNVMGIHNVGNALAAVAVADHAGVDLKLAVKGLEGFRGFKMRQQLYETAGYTIIDDSYNASPDSMRAGLKVLETFDREGDKVAVLADMWELGEREKEYHFEIGEFITGLNIDEVITIGELSKEIVKGIESKSSVNKTGKKILLKQFKTNKEIADYLKGRMKKEDTVLLKGSRGMKLNEISEFLVKQQKKGC
jgi:UDP-N-acetylmuramoyl-tripeptide--D-alanyl-D-alanine ligase